MSAGIMEAIDYGRASKYTDYPLRNLLETALIQVINGMPVKQAQQEIGIPSRTIRRYYNRWKKISGSIFFISVEPEIRDMDGKMELSTHMKCTEAELKEFRTIWNQK